MFTGEEIVAALQKLGTTDVVWIPDSALGPWETALVRAKGLRLIRVCREGEAWPLAAGLLLGGRQPMVIMQSTGLFESGDALRNILFDLKLPLLSIIGARSYLLTQSSDTARKFINPLLQAWAWTMCSSSAKTRSRSLPIICSPSKRRGSRARSSSRKGECKP